MSKKIYMEVINHISSMMCLTRHLEPREQMEWKDCWEFTIEVEKNMPFEEDACQ